MTNAPASDSAPLPFPAHTNGAGRSYPDKVPELVIARSEDQSRRRRILAIILLSLLVQTVLLASLVLHQMVKLGDAYRGIPLAFLVLMAAIYVCLLVANRRGYTRGASYVFLGTFFFALVWSNALWGAMLPSPLLGYALFIVMAAITLGGTASLAAAGMSILAITVVSLGEQAHGILPAWQHKLVNASDLIAHVVLLSAAAFLSWFSNRELEKSLRRARASEAALTVERDNLEQMVEERTRAWREAELARSVELSRLAEFGKASAGLFHDLMNPLTAISLSVQRMSEDAPGDAHRQAKESVDGAIGAARRIESLIAKTRRFLKAGTREESFDGGNELRDVVETLEHQARKQGVSVNLAALAPLPLSGDPLRFYQAFANIVGNAIDCYHGVPHSRPRTVDVVLEDGTAGPRVIVRDRGCGMSAEVLARIFDPFFTTKEQGIGLGLSIARDALASFGAELRYESAPGAGTTAIASFPAR